MNIKIDESKLENKDSWANKLPGLLRILGATALLIGMYSFLIKGWDDGNDIYRYLFMLGHTGALAAIGLASGHWLKESKGARLLLTLSLVSIPANFAILGAFIYSKTSLLELEQYPSYVSWSIDSFQTAALTTVGAMLVLLPVTLLAFTTLARSISKRLSVLYIIGNLSLLIPTREPLIIGLIGISLLMVLIFNVKKLTHSHIVTKTRDGILALGLLTLPLVILISRTLWLYSADMFLMTIIVMMAYFVLQQITLLLSTKSVAQDILSILTLLSAFLIAPLLYVSLIETQLDFAAVFLTASISVSALMIFKINTTNENNSAIFRRLSGLLVVVGAFVNMLLNAGLLATILCLISGVVLLFIGYDKKLRHFFIYGIVLIMLGLAQQFYKLVYQFNFGSWISMAVMGVITIIIASIIEAKGATILKQYSSLKEKFQYWER